MTSSRAVLPASVSPRLWRVRLRVEDQVEESQRFSGALLGEIEVNTEEFSVQKNDAAIVLNSFDSKVLSAGVRAGPISAGGTFPVEELLYTPGQQGSGDNSLNGFAAAREIKFNEEDHQVHLRFEPDALAEMLSKPGSSHTGSSMAVLTLFITFAGHLNDEMCGFYRSTYADSKTQEEKVMYTTQFEPADACRAFPCFDQPDKKAVFEISLVVPRWMTCLGNMPVASTEDLPDAEGSHKLVTFEPTVRMSSYLVGFICGEFDFCETTNQHGVLCRVYTTPGCADQGRFALETGARALDFFEDFFGIAYPLPKLDQIAIPDFSAGAMENWGIVTYRESFMLAPPEGASVQVKQDVAETVAHELAHQWFGNLVTMEWWCDLWLKEGFANFIGTFCVAALFPEWDIWADFVSKYDEMAMTMDALDSTHSIEVEVNHPDDLNEIYDSITYEKSASVIRHTRALIGEDAFRAGLVRYLQKHSYRNTVAVDLFDAWSEASGRNMEDLVRPYTKNPGFALVTVREGGESDDGVLSLEISQDRFFATGLVPQDESLWPIPLLPRSVVATGTPSKCKRCAEGSCFAFSNEKEAIVSSKSSSVKITRHVEHVADASADERLFIKLNADQQCFYRVRYSPELTLRLVTALKGRSMQLSTADRVGLVSDAFALSWACLQPAQQSFELVRSLADEDNFSVWNAIVTGLIRHGSVWDGEPSFVQYCRMVRSLVRPKVDELGWTPVKGESDRQALLRRIILGCAVFAEDEDVIAAGRKLFAEFAKDPHNDAQPVRVGVASDCVELLFRCEVMAGGATGYAAVRKIFEETTVDVTKEDTLAALCRTPDRAQARELLDWAFTDAVRPQNKHLAFALGRYNRHCRDVALDWLLDIDNFKKVHAALDASGLVTRCVSSSLGALRSEDAIERAEAFFKENSAYYRKVTRTMAQSVESVRANMRWLAHNRPGGSHGSQDLTSWLQEQYPRAASVLKDLDRN